MNYYFFPKIIGINSSVVLSNFKSYKSINFKEKLQIIYAAWSDGNVWHYRPIKTINPGESIELFRNELPDPENPNVFVFFHYNEIPSSSKELFVSNHMAGTPSWRANFKFASEKTVTSVQTEYQSEMVRFIKKGNMVSISSMFQPGKNVFNKFIFMNISLSPEITEHNVYFADPLRTKVLATHIVKKNTCNVIGLDKINIPTNTPVLVITKTIPGVPIFLSHNESFSELSVEHSHPPASLVSFCDTWHLQKKLKNYWINKFSGISADATN